MYFGGARVQDLEFYIKPLAIRVAISHHSGIVHRKMMLLSFYIWDFSNR